MQIPEQGQLVQVRGRHYLVQDVWAGAADPGDIPHHRVRLEALDDDQLGETLDVLWEHEIHRQVFSALGLPRPDTWDPQDRFEAFLLATRWGLSSVLEGLPLQAPFRGAIQIEEYQLEPVVRALRMPRVNLLIADDVGLGKTIEAGLVMQELLARQRIRRVLIVCPASLQRQWAEEMISKFTLRFEIVDRAFIHRIRKEYGPHVNAWASYPRLITSMDFLKREEPLSSFRASLKSARSAGLRDWGLLIVDEAHNVAPSGRKSYVRDSDRTRMMREIIGHFEHRLFLTATPHNGFTISFTALLEMLDPLRFSRGPSVNKAHRDAVMIRRLKDDMVDALGQRRFPERTVLPLEVKLADKESQLVELLDTYMSKRLSRIGDMDRMPVRFTMTLLKKRMLSSPRAFRHSIDVHQAHLEPDEKPDAENARVVASLHDQMQEDFSDDLEKDRTEETAITESATFFAITDEERQLVDQMQKIALELHDEPDTKVEALFAWIQEKLLPAGKWNDDRLLIFTEYKDSLEYLKRMMERKGWGERILTLYGGMPVGDVDADDPIKGGREYIKRTFCAPPSIEPMRILIATDAASEGLNLQEHCRYLIHYEIPWNPNKMEQRNGRIDRHGQKAEEVFCHHFLYLDHEDSKFLQTVVDKVGTIRADLGGVGDVIAEQVEEAMLGKKTQELLLPEDRKKRVRDEVLADKVTKDRIRELRSKLREARTIWRLQPETLQLVLEEGLRLVEHPGLTVVDEGPLAGKAWYLKSVPPSWADCRPSIQDSKSRLLKLVFDERFGRDHKDVTLLHLDHPLIRRALSAFRKNLWSAGLHTTHQMSRASFRVLPDRDLQVPVIILFSRLVCVGKSGQKLHEDFWPMGGEIRQEDIEWLDAGDLEPLLELQGSHPTVPSSVANRLRLFFASHEKLFEEKLGDVEKALAKDTAERLRKHATDEARHVRGLIDERIKELEKRIKEAEKDTEKARQLKLTLALDEREQYEEDERHLKRRLEELRKERENEPKKVKERYALRTARAFPLALLYLLPESLLAGGKP